VEQPDWERQAAEEELQRQRELAAKLEAKREARELAKPSLPWYSQALEWVVHLYDPGRASREANQIYPPIAGTGMPAIRFVWLIVMLAVVLVAALMMRACVVPFAVRQGEAREQFLQQQAEMERMQQEVEQARGY